MAYLLNGSKEAAGQQVAQMFESDPAKGQVLLHELCDHLLDPQKPFLNKKDAVDWIKVLFGEQVGFDAICSKIRSLDSSSLCGCVWTAQFIAYRCRTCATSPCMSLCAACFENGNHEGHDYNIFRSEAGGACDCGDSSVMRKSGFCSHHGPNRVIPPAPPPGFLAAGKVLLDRMFLSVIQFLRNLSTYLENDAQLPPLFSHFLSFILDLIKLGSPVRSHLSGLLLNETLYADLAQCKGYKCLEDENSNLRAFHKQTIEWFREAVEGMDTPPIVTGIKDKGQFARCFQYKNYLDEITFWIVRYMFPEPLILIVLNLLPDADMKREFSKCFARHYTRVAQSLSRLRTADLDPLSNRVVHISVQLFSNDELAYMLCKEENLLQIFMISMHNIISPSLVSSETHPGDMHQCVSCSSDMMRLNVYWPVVSDLVNVLGHVRVARLFLCDLDLLQCWFQEVLSFCGMASNKRALDSHVEFEPDQNQLLIGFYTEREACASPLWCLLAALQTRDSVVISLSVIRSLLDTLQDFFDAIGLTESSSLRFDQASFHYPLHRYLAHFISNAIKKQGATINNFGISEVAARTLIIHPLQVLITTFEVQCAMWVRNGLYIASQSLAYRQYFFSKFFIDADLFLIQFCATLLPPHFIVALIFERCRVLSCLKISDKHVIPSYTYPHGGLLGVPSEEKLLKMMEAAFQLLQYIVAINCLKNASDEESMRNEMISLLAIKPSTFSSLTDHTPHSHESQTGKKSIDYINMLHRIIDTYAAKKEGDAMEQTKYVANDKAWKLYDPLYTQYRSLYQRDVQKAHTNYVNHLQQTGRIDSTVSETSLWPPYQPVNSLPEKFHSLEGLLRSRLLHSLIFIVLHNESVFTDATVSIALHLLESALRLTSPCKPDVDAKSEVYDQTWCLPLLKWYDTDNPIANMIKVVSFEKPISQTSLSMDDFDTESGFACVFQTTECIASLLIKLHDKISGKKCSFSLSPERLKTAMQDDLPSTRLNVISTILHIAAAKSKEAEQTIRIIYKSLAPTPSPSDSSLNTSLSGENERENRRRKARLAQERLMKQFALKQKQFLESSESMDVTDTDATACPTDLLAVAANDDLSPGDFGLQSFARYECVICGSVEVELQASQIDEERCSSKLMGLICLLQPSAVLGHRSTSELRSSLYKPGKRPSSLEARTCRTRVMKKINLTESLFDCELHGEYFTLTRAAIEGSHVSTCGHYVHLKCHSQYMDSIQSLGRSQLSYNLIRGFQCPLCRQVSNLILPCNVRAKQKNYPGVPLYRSAISKAWMDTLNDITAIIETDSLGCTTIRASRGLGLSLNLMLLTRYNVEMAAMNLDCSQSELGESSGSSRLASQRKSPIGSLFILLHWLCQVGDSKDARSGNIALAKRILDRLSGVERAEFLAHDVPLLMMDPISLLIQLLLDSPLLLDNFQTIVHQVYNLVFVQALLNISDQFSPDERRAWKNNISVSLGGIPFSPQSLDCLVGLLIHLLPDQLFQFSSESMDASYVETVFTVQSVYGGIEKRLINFLRLASILQQQLFPFKEFPKISSPETEFGNFAAYLGFCPEVEVATVDVIKCLRWNNAKLILTRWCSEITDVVQRRQDAAKVLICEHPLWFPPKLIKLPHEYSTLFQLYRVTRCHRCGVIPNDPCLCLICGEYLCYKSMCQKTEEEEKAEELIKPFLIRTFGRQQFAACRHARRCGAGTSILLQVNTSYIVIIRGTRCCLWGTLYLDGHGEEDRGWRRGKPLFLKKQRLELLEQQWRHHLFDNTAKDWTGHRSAI